MHRRNFISLSTLGALSIPFKTVKPKKKVKPIVISTWDAGVNANKAAWNILYANGKAIDAVEKGVMVTEDEMNCCVGLGANPDREGFVTLDASIMDEHGNCGAVGFLERIKHPISVARKVMENSPHVLLVGEGAQKFALAQGFSLEPNTLSKNAEKNYKNWLKKSEYKPLINREKLENQPIAPPKKLDSGEFNHDTIGMIALDAHGNLSGSCTTSGQGFKMRGRLGDSPIIGAGLFVDNEIGAAVSTGQGEEVIRIAGCSLVVEFMRQGFSPEMACKKAIERLIKTRGVEKLKELQICFIAINKNGEHGSYALQKGFEYAVYSHQTNNQLFKSKFLI
jgi:N4-(beta-N-acetylglucosaminyl)-L-asparaginase